MNVYLHFLTSDEDKTIHFKDWHGEQPEVGFSYELTDTHENYVAANIEERGDEIHAFLVRPN